MNQAEKNSKKYLKPPKWEDIEKMINDFDVSISKFEKFYGIPYGVLRLVKIGNRELPVKFWHIIYEKIIPKNAICFVDMTALGEFKKATNKTKPKTPTAKKAPIKLNNEVLAKINALK